MDYRIELIKLLNMQNGFNHRKTVSIITLLTSLLLVITFYGCRTSKRIVEKSKVDIEKSELKINKIDSSVVVHKNNILNKVDSLSWSNYMKEFNFSFNGLDNSDELEITKTDNGFKIKGKGSVNGSQKQVNNDSLKKEVNNTQVQENTSVRENEQTQNNITENSSVVDKNKESHTLGFTIGVVIALILLGALIIYLLYKYLLKKKY